MHSALSPSSHRAGALFRSGLLAALAWLVLATLTPAAQAALVYTASGGTITGTLGTTAFTNATWRITATGDAANVQSGVFAGVIPGLYNYVSPTLFLDTGAGVVTATLLDTAGASWAALSLDYTSVGADFVDSALALIPSSLDDANGFAVTHGLPASNLVSPGTWFGDSQVTRVLYDTSLGSLTITGDTEGPGEFSVAAVPVPATWALLALGLAGLRLRRGR